MHSPEKLEILDGMVRAWKNKQHDLGVLLEMKYGHTLAEYAPKIAPETTTPPPKEDEGGDQKSEGAAAADVSGPPDLLDLPGAPMKDGGAAQDRDTAAIRARPNPAAAAAAGYQRPVIVDDDASREAFKGIMARYYAVYNEAKVAHLDDMVDEWFLKKQQLDMMLHHRYGVSLSDFSLGKGQTITRIGESKEVDRARNVAGLHDFDGGTDANEEGDGDGGNGRFQRRSYENTYPNVKKDTANAMDKGVLPGGVAAAGAQRIAILNISGGADAEEATIVPSPEVIIDCGGDAIFSGGPESSPSLLVIDLRVEFRNCLFGSPASNAAGVSVMAQHSMVRFVDCAFEGGGGGLMIDYGSMADLRRTNFTRLSGGAGRGGGLKMGTTTSRIGGVERKGATVESMHRGMPFAYLSRAVFSRCSAAFGGAATVARGTFFCNGCEFKHNSASSGGGALFLMHHSYSSITYSELTTNSADEGGAVYQGGGTAIFGRTIIHRNAAAQRGGGLMIAPASIENPLMKQAGALYHTILPASWSTMIYSQVDNNRAMGTARLPAAGGGLYIQAGGSMSFERCSLSGNLAAGRDSEGGCFAMRDGGILYVRDTVVANSSAGYGGALRLYTQTEGALSILFDNATIAYNTAVHFGSVLAAHSHTSALFSKFTYSGGRFNYNVDPDAFRSRPSDRFGFNADPNLYSERANAAPEGTVIEQANVYEPRFYTLTLPNDGRLTNQWPFFASGERFAGYTDVKTTKGQKAASGGVAFLIRTAAGRKFGDDEMGEFSGVCGFKDSNIHSNTDTERSVCFMHSSIDTQQCMNQMRLL